MTREEEINNAKEVFYRKILQEGTYYDPRDCFEEGAEWADNHPKSPWISVKDDLPCNHLELLINKGVTKKVFVLKFGDSPGVDFMLRVNGEWIWFAYENHKFWMPIPEPPKE